MLNRAACLEHHPEPPLLDERLRAQQDDTQWVGWDSLRRLKLGDVGVDSRDDKHDKSQSEWCSLVPNADRGLVGKRCD